MERGLILVADEDHRTYNLLSQLLDGRRYELVQSARGADVVEAARWRRPDVIFLSADTPHVDQVCEALKQDAQLSTVPLVLLERPGSTRLGTDGAARADYFIAKPLKLQTLAPALARLMPGAGQALAGPPPLETVELDDTDIELTPESEPDEDVTGGDSEPPAATDGESPDGGNAIGAFLRELDRSQSLYKQKIERLQAELTEARRETRRLGEERQRAFDAAEAAHIEKEAVMERLGEEIVERERTARTLEQLLRGAIMERSLLEAEVKVVNDRISGMRDELKQAQEDAVGRIEAVRDEYQSVLEQHMEDAERERETLEARAHAAEQAATAEAERFAALASEAEAARADQESAQEAGLQAELDAARAALEVVVAERNAATEELEAATAALDEAMRDAQRWQEAAQSAQTLAAEAGGSLGALREEEARLTALVETHKARVADLERELQARKDAEADLHAQVGALKARAELLDTTETALAEALAAVKRADERGRAAADERDAARSAAEAAARRAEATAEQAKADQARQKGQLTESLAKAQELATEHQRLTQQIAGLEELLGNAMDEAEQAREELHAMESHLAGRDRTIDALTARERELTAVVEAAAEIQDALVEATREGEQLRAEFEASEQRAAGLVAALDDARREALAAQVRSSELEREAADLRAQGVELGTERERLLARAVALESQVGLLEDELRTRGGELEAAKAQAAVEADALRARVADAAREAAQANEAVAALQEALRVERQGQEQAQAALDALQAAMEEAREGHALATQQAQEARDALAAAAREGATAREALAAAARELEDTRTQAERERAAGDARIAEQDAALDAARSALKALREEHDAAVSEAREAAAREDAARASADQARASEQRLHADADSLAQAQLATLRGHTARLEQEVALLESELRDARSLAEEVPIREATGEHTVSEPVLVAAAVDAATAEELERARAALEEITRERNSLNMQVRTLRLSLDESRNRAKELEGALRDLSKAAALAPPPPPGAPSAEQEEATARLRKELRGASESIRMCLLELEQSRDRLETGRREIVQGREGLAQLFSDWQKLESLLRDMAQDAALRPALAKIASVLKDVRSHVRETRGILEHGEQLVRTQDELTTNLYRVLTRTAN